VRAAAAIAQVPGRIEGQTDAIAIAPRLAGDDGNLLRHSNATALQRFAQDGLFESQLALIVRVLVMAAAANAEVRAGGRNALRRGANNLLGLGGRIAGFALRNAHPRLLAGQRERHKNGLALQPSQKSATVDWLLDFDELRFGGRYEFYSPHNADRISASFRPEVCFPEFFLPAECFFAACLARRCIVICFLGVIAGSCKRD
jgi:hypothetical protein